MACKYSSESQLLLGKIKHQVGFITKSQFVCSCLWQRMRLQAGQLKKPRRISTSLSYFPTDTGMKTKNLAHWRGKTRGWMRVYILRLPLLEYKEFSCAWISLLNLFVSKLHSSVAELNKLRMSELQVPSCVLS